MVNIEKIRDDTTKAERQSARECERAVYLTVTVRVPYVKGYEGDSDRDIITGACDAVAGLDNADVADMLCVALSEIKDLEWEYTE